MKLPSQVINYRWTAFDATSAHLSQLFDTYATPYRIHPRALDKGRRGLEVGVPGLDSDGWAFDVDGGFDVGELVSFSLSLSSDPPSVARFFRSGYAWVDLPHDVSPEGKNIQDVLEACFESDPIRFPHFDPKVVLARFALESASNWPEKTPSSPIKMPGVLLNPYNYPWGDLGMLHFDYWEHTDLRAALINSKKKFESPDWGGSDVGKGFASFFLELLSDEPHNGLVDWPWKLPAEEGGHKLSKVLARLPMPGVPVHALPTAIGAQSNATPNGRCVSVLSMPAPRIELDGFGRQTISPLRDPARLLAGPFARRLRASKLRFCVTIPFPALTTRLEIYRGDSLYYREVHNLGEFILPGMHIWCWDGYDKDGVFDSAALKGSNFSARLSVTDAKGRTSVASTPLATGADRIRWADVRIDSNNRGIEVTTYAHFLNPSEMPIFDLRLRCDWLSGVLDGFLGGMAGMAAQGAGWLAMLPSLANAWPDDAGTWFDDILKDWRALFQSEGQESGTENDASRALDKYMGALPQLLNTGELDVSSELGRILSGGDLDKDTFERFRTAALSGIARHWSRSVRIEGEDWDVRVSCRERTTDAQRTYFSSSSGLVASLSNTRSFNLSAIKEGLPIFNIWDDQDLLPEAEVTRGWVTDVDARIARTCAHELGHSVLRERKDWIYSMLHKGTSSLSQKSLPDSPFHLEEDEHGNINWEVDLMFYHNDASSRPADSWQARERAEATDVCVLLNMAKVSFG